MKIVPVIDLKGGRVVHAIAGNRRQYQNVKSKLVEGSDPVQVAQALIAATHAQSIYVADLDSLVDQRNPDVGQFKRLLSLEVDVWIDADWAAFSDAFADLILLNNFRPVFSLESVPRLESLKQLFGLASQHRPIFSLDLFDGQPMASASIEFDSIHELIEQVIRIGFRNLIVLDLATVGTGCGPQISKEIVHYVNTNKQCRWTTGGGVRSVEDIQFLRRAGFTSVLVASSVHSGRLSNDDCKAIHQQLDV